MNVGLKRNEMESGITQKNVDKLFLLCVGCSCNVNSNKIN